MKFYINEESFPVLLLGTSVSLKGCSGVLAKRLQHEPLAALEVSASLETSQQDNFMEQEGIFSKKKNTRLRLLIQFYKNVSLMWDIKPWLGIKLCWKLMLFAFLILNCFSFLESKMDLDRHEGRCCEP